VFKKYDGWASNCVVVVVVVIIMIIIIRCVGAKSLAVEFILMRFPEKVGSGLGYLGVFKRAYSTGSAGVGYPDH